MPLYTKCIFEPSSSADGIRICVMSRLTLSDGTTHDPRIGTYHEWRKRVAPPDKLVGDYYKRDLPWQDFERQYLAYLRTEENATHVRELAHSALHQTTTILCVERDPVHCHRRLLAEECQRLLPALPIFLF